MKSVGLKKNNQWDLKKIIREKKIICGVMKKSPEQKESALGNISHEKREVLLLEISLVETSEASAVASLVLSHFVNCIVDGIRTLLLSELGNAELILACTLLSSDTSLEIALCITQNLTQ